MEHLFAKNPDGFIEMKHLLIANIKEGKLMNPKPLNTLLGSLPNGKYLIEINGANKRSSQQNRYYWGLCVPLIQQGIKHLGTDLTKEECHEFLKSRFNTEELINPETAECVLIPRSTTNLSKIQFMEYIAKIQQFGSEFLGIVIPDPGQQIEVNYE
jgi:hypothetical protein